MKDIKVKSKMKQPKTKNKVNFAARDAKSIMRVYLTKQESKRENENAKANANDNAVNSVETGAERATTYCAQVIKIKAQKFTKLSVGHKSSLQRRKSHVISKLSRKTVRVSRRILSRLYSASIKTSAVLVNKLMVVSGAAVPVLLILVMVVAVAAIAASPFGIFFSAEDTSPGTQHIANVVGDLKTEFNAKLIDIQSSNLHDKIEAHGNLADWSEVLAIFAVKTASGNADIMDVVTIDNTRISLFKKVFWDMNRIESIAETDPDENEVLKISIKNMIISDMIREYRFNEKQIKDLNSLLEHRDMLRILAENTEITDRYAQEVLRNLPVDLSPERKAVVKSALSLVGKVNYFWGGKSSAIGWDNTWGKPQTVASAGSPSTGTNRLSGLDCSGFVAWVFKNARLSDIGQGTFEQYNNSVRISWDKAQPGDLVFYDDLSHVGIVVGKDMHYNIIIVHCNGLEKNISLSSNIGFGFCSKFVSFIA